MPTKNESTNIGAFLDSVPRQLNVIIVDASFDNTREINHFSSEIYAQLIKSKY